MHFSFENAMYGMKLIIISISPMSIKKRLLLLAWSIHIRISPACTKVRVKVDILVASTEIFDS